MPLLRASRVYLNTASMVTLTPARLLRGGLSLTDTSPCGHNDKESKMLHDNIVYFIVRDV